MTIYIPRKNLCANFVRLFFSFFFGNKVNCLVNQKLLLSILFSSHIFYIYFFLTGNDVALCFILECLTLFWVFAAVIVLFQNFRGGIK